MIDTTAPDPQTSPLPQTPPDSNTEMTPQVSSGGRKRFFRSKIFIIILIFVLLGIGSIAWYLSTNKTAQTALNTVGNLGALKEVLETANITPSPGVIIRQTGNNAVSPSQPASQGISGQQQQQPQPEQQPAPETGQNTEQNKNDISKWDTYQSSYGFTLKFPAGYGLTESNQGFGVSHIEITNPASPFPDVPDFQILIFPKSVGALINQNFDEKYALSDNSSTIMEDETGKSKFTKIRNRTVGSLRAFDFSIIAEPPDPEEEIGIGTYIEAGTKVIIISTFESEKAKLESMLASFSYTP